MKQHPLIQSVEKTLLEFSMLKSGDKVLVAVSGGPDSVALLHVLLTLQTKFDIRIGVAHLNHGLRPSAATRDAAFVSSLCNKTDLPSHVATVDIRGLHQQQGGSLEALGRKARYNFFSRISRKFGYNKIAMGHQADDNAELVLMNLFRGSGPLGLSGIPPVRNNRYIRPLIEQTRESIMNYLQDNQVAFVLDATNNDLRFLRNRIRHELVPELIHRYNPNLVDTLNRTAAIFRAEEDWLNHYSGRIFNTLADGDATSIRMPVSKLLENHGAIQRRTIRAAIKHVKGNLKSITLQHIDAVLNLCREGSPGRILCLPGRLVIRKQPGDHVSISRQPSLPPSRENSRPGETIPLYTISVPHPDVGTRTVMVKESGTTLVLGSMPVESMGSLTSAGQHTAFFDMDKLTFPMLLRDTLPGDRFMPLGMQGTQKVKNFFINNKVPREIRRKTPVLVSRDVIVWIVGHRIDERVKITQQTKNVLKIELFLA
ncbi:MAG: tRNA lysidine(34) synthetase TilS [Deltaproteobacteria bacterium]|nr:MAG: tRNA lysidine(34) synthetase TilS [Deltaproteobacteria bacterium]RLC13603.1 MAG: tRNA lysidine(34) synthetase TilS [Deltaproteobacteria bacterium]